MKRSDALQPLSHDHHQGLFAAQKLSRATSQSAADAQRHFLAFWRDEGQRHFRVEEEVLLPAYALHNPADAPEVVRVLTEHLRIRSFAAVLAAGPADPQRLHELGELLRDHIRHEERTLFGLVERGLSEQELSELRVAIAAAEAAP